MHYRNHCFRGERRIRGQSFIPIVAVVHKKVILFCLQNTNRIPNVNLGLPQCLSKESTCQSGRCRFDTWVRKIAWRRKWQPTPVFLPGKSHGQQSLMGYIPWGNKNCREPVRHSTRDKGHEEGGSAYAKVGSSQESPWIFLSIYPQKTRVCLLYCFVLSPLTLLGAVPHHHIALSVNELTYSSN